MKHISLITGIVAIFVVVMVSVKTSKAASFLDYNTIESSVKKAENPVAVDRDLYNNSHNISLNQYLYLLFAQATEGEAPLNDDQYNQFMEYIIASGALPKYRSDIFEQALRYAKGESTLWEKTKHIGSSALSGAFAGGVAGAALGPTGEFIKDPRYWSQSPQKLATFAKERALEPAVRFGVAGAGIGGLYGLYRGVATRNAIHRRLPRYSRPISERIGLISRRKGTQ